MKKRGTGQNAGKAKARAGRSGLPSRHDWRTTDEQEIEKRRQRAREEPPRIRKLNPKFPIHTDFEVMSRSGMTYRVEILDLAQGLYSSSSPDFRVNGLGTDKHVEAVLQYLHRQHSAEFDLAMTGSSERIDLLPGPDGQSLVVRLGKRRLPAGLREAFDPSGRLLDGVTPEEGLSVARAVRNDRFRISQEVDFWMERRRLERERTFLRHEYEQKVHRGEYPLNETTQPLYPYQREGALHLAFKERALLADEMGLGKTIQGIAACAILRRMGRATRVLVVTPASLKTEWEEQIRKFTDLDLEIVMGRRSERVRVYRNPPFFTLVNYEQMRTDALEVNEHLRPDIVVLDEAQRIKNWSSKTARAVKRLRSRYAFVLTGTPIENRIDELYSIVDFLDPSVFGPLFRFNRQFYQLDDKGRPEAYRNLLDLRERVNPLVLRRRKVDVESELPDRSDLQRFVELTDEQRELYDEHYRTVGQLARKAKLRPLTEIEQRILMKELAMMRMLCNTRYILEEGEFRCPKLEELDKILDECLSDADVKVIVFSEWVRMLDLVRRLLEKKGIGYAVHTGRVPQAKRRREIQMFKRDPGCRVFLCSESGSTGLNLQVASVVINCDLPWNPAKLEQRIARAWRKHQCRPVTVINLIARGTIEHGMLVTLADKQSLAEGILDQIGELDTVPLRKGGQTFLKRLEQVLLRPSTEAPAVKKMPEPTDRPEAFAREARGILGRQIHRIEELYLDGDATTGTDSKSVVLVVAEDPDEVRARLDTLRKDLFGRTEAGEGGDEVAVTVEVLSPETYEAIERLKAAGLISSHVRATRPLAAAEGAVPVLSSEDRLRVEDHLRDSLRKQKAVHVLLNAELIEEAVDPLRGGVLRVLKAAAIVRGWPEPESLDDPGALERAATDGFVRDWVTDGSNPKTASAVLSWMQVMGERITKALEG